MPSLPSLIRRAPRDLLAAPISAFESETQAVLVRTAPYSEHAIMHVLVGIIFIAVILMSVVKLDRVVSSAGRLVPTGGSLFVQPLDRSIVRQIKVRTGDVVKAGQVLADLDPTFAQADMKQQEDRLASLSATLARLEAEQAGKPYEGDDTPAGKLQLSIWHQRQTELQQTLADFDARIRSDESTITRSQQDLQSYTQRLGYAVQYSAMQEALEKDGNTSKVKVLSAHDSQAEAARQVSQTRNIPEGTTECGVQQMAERYRHPTGNGARRF
jgi:hemolysin D